tara:strand:- start:49067 stop:49405 length:339 start_codon:yes stop_codon:yes gene_type:complete
MKSFSEFINESKVRMKKLLKGHYESKFPIVFTTKMSVAGAKPSKPINGDAKVTLSRNESLGMWVWSLEVHDKSGNKIYTESDPYPFNRKREALLTFQDMADSTKDNPYEFYV